MNLLYKIGRNDLVSFINLRKGEMQYGFEENSER